MDPIEIANAETIEGFIQNYMPAKKYGPPFQIRGSCSRESKLKHPAQFLLHLQGLILVMIGSANLRHSEDWKVWTHPQTRAEYQITLQPAKALSEPDFEDCFRLLEFTSSDDYRKSQNGWKPRKKRQEMKLLDLKYILIKHDNKVEGFVSFMPTFEDSYPVIYCYEIHLSSALQG